MVPTRKVGAGGELEREANGSLAKLAHWVRRHISDDELRTSQLPDVVPVVRASVKPRSWYAKPHHLARMLEMARPVLRTEGEVLKWARRESAHLGGRRPIELIETDARAAEVFDYLETYIRKPTRQGRRSGPFVLEVLNFRGGKGVRGMGLWGIPRPGTRRFDSGKEQANGKYQARLFSCKLKGCCAASFGGASACLFTPSAPPSFHRGAKAPC
uniref:MbcA/ParS/Xre antitoxin family protein n=1 Tax=Neorhizobium sp. EC2-8 TaxID=3129230 RepID=UPI00310119AE